MIPPISVFIQQVFEIMKLSDIPIRDTWKHNGDSSTPKFNLDGFAKNNGYNGPFCCDYNWTHLDSFAEFQFGSEDEVSQFYYIHNFESLAYDSYHLNISTEYLYDLHLSYSPIARELVHLLQSIPSKLEVKEFLINQKSSGDEQLTRLELEAYFVQALYIMKYEKSRFFNALKKKGYHSDLNYYDKFKYYNDADARELLVLFRYHNLI
ncbi:hypothetical protein HK099_000359 [Clydaea vesicula]|uniref:Uncharacterized protein n=1 Tax=Clydaea vesicula TaxID=447962 RepID=A0AAD5TXC5_9FUNG|nr:hypothetical protein HK099_000359 [Clydaea vesicula]